MCTNEERKTERKKETNKQIMKLLSFVVNSDVSRTVTFAALCDFIFHKLETLHTNILQIFLIFELHFVHKISVIGLVHPSACHRLCVPFITNCY
jgi:hypothetical protein